MGQLQKTLGPLMIWGLGVGYVISGAYFGWNLGLPVGGPYGMLLATALVTVLYVTFVLGYAELACALPRAGGVFVYTSRAFGPHLGVLAGVAQLIEYTLAPAGIAFAIGSYINQAHPGIPVMAGALVAYLVFTAVNMVGVKLSVSFEFVLTVIAVIELLVFGFVVLPNFSWEAFSRNPLPAGWGGAFAAIPFAMWFYLAIEGVANIAEEARDPQKDLPRGFSWTMITLVILTAITLFGAVGVGGWEPVVYPDVTDPTVTSDSPLPLAIAQIVDRESPYFLALTGIGLVGLVASFHGIIIVASRSLLELGRVHYAPKALGHINSKTHTPVNALVVNLVIGLVALASGRTTDIILLTVFGALTLYAFSTASVFALRKHAPHLERPFKTPLYPFVPAVALVLILVAMAAMIYNSPLHAAIYAGILLVAWLAFIAFVPKTRRTTFED